MNDSEETHLFCTRCGCDLTPGLGDFYIVRIDALADPTPPIISDNGGDMDINEQFSRLFEEMRHMTERELMDQVHRSLTIHLCGQCYGQWIENPAG